MIFRFLDFELDSALCELRRQDEILSGDRRILDLLLYLIRHRERVVPRRELLSEVWGSASVNERVLHQALYAARKLLRDDVREPRVLATLRARGVRFIADVVELNRRRGVEAKMLPGVGPFVGREDALAELQAALEGSREGRGGVVLISGEAGIGKSRLCEKFAERAKQQGVLVHIGRCPDTEGAPAFRPWIQLLRSHVKQISLERWSGQAEEWPDVAQMAPELSPGGPRPRTYSELDVGPVRFRLFDGVSRFWMEMAQEVPRLLILEDVQFADESSWQFLRFIARDAAQANLLIVATFRESDLQAVTGRAAGVGEMLREPGSRSLLLLGFTSEEVAEYLELVLDRPVSPDICRSLHQRSAGNPFFLSHLVPLLGSDAENWKLTSRAALPSSLRDAIKRQLAALPETVRELLEVAAVGGADVALDVLASATDRDPARLLADLSPALVAGVVGQDRDREGVLRFVHSLVAEALYDGFPDADRARWHHRLAVAIERVYEANIGPHLAQLAHHYGLSVDERDIGKTILYCTRAGVAACDQFAFEEAIPLLGRALDVADQRGADDGSLCDILLALGEAQTRVGARGAARETFRRAADLAASIGAPERLAAVALAMVPGFLTIEAGVFDAYAVQTLERALESLGNDQLQLRAKLSARLASILYWEPGTQARRKALIKDATAIADSLEDTEVLAFVLAGSLAAMSGPDNSDARQKLAFRAVALAELVGQKELALLSRVFLIAAQFEQARLDEFALEIDVLEQLIDNHRIPHARWYPSLYKANLALQSGNLAKAELLAGEIVALGQRLGDANVQHSVATIIGTIRFHQCRIEEVVGSTAELADRYPRLPVWRVAHALMLILTGELDHGRSQFESLFHRVGTFERDNVWLISLVLLAEACVELGDRPRARHLLSCLQRYSGRVAAFGQGMSCWGSVARVLGRLAVVAGDYRTARRRFEEAVQIETRAGLWLWLPYSQLELAELILVEGRSVETGLASALIRACEASVRRIGLRALEARSARVAKEVGVVDLRT